MGSGTSYRFGPKFFMEKDVVLVTINYRLGPLGFLNLDIPEAPGNAGLKDQVYSDWFSVYRLIVKYVHKCRKISSGQIWIQ